MNQSGGWLLMQCDRSLRTTPTAVNRLLGMLWQGVHPRLPVCWPAHDTKRTTLLACTLPVPAAILAVRQQQPYISEKEVFEALEKIQRDKVRSVLTAFRCGLCTCVVASTLPSSTPVRPPSPMPLVHLSTTPVPPPCSPLLRPSRCSAAVAA